MRLAWTRVCVKLFGGAQGTLVSIAAYRSRRRLSLLSMSNMQFRGNTEAAMIRQDSHSGVIGVAL